MRIFKDTKGRSYTVDVTHAAILRVIAHTGVDLRQAQSEETIRAIHDPFRCFEIVWAIVSEATDISFEDFSASVDGDTYYAMTVALTDSITDFFRQVRPMMKDALDAADAKMKEAETEVAVRATQMVQTIDVEEIVKQTLASNGQPTDGTK